MSYQLSDERTKKQDPGNKKKLDRLTTYHLFLLPHRTHSLVNIIPEKQHQQPERAYYR